MRLNIIQILKNDQTKRMRSQEGKHTHTFWRKLQTKTRNTQVFKVRMQDVDFSQLIPFTDNYPFLKADKSKITDHFQKTKKYS